jgi:hypothetical protein
MHALLNDLRHALRALRRGASLSFVIIASLAIGIGTNTAIFSVANALMLKPLPYRDPDRLAVLWLRSPGLNIPQDWPSPGQYIDIRTDSRSFEELSISQGRDGTLLGLDQPERVEVLRTSSGCCWATTTSLDDLPSPSSATISGVDCLAPTPTWSAEASR